MQYIKTLYIRIPQYIHTFVETFRNDILALFSDKYIGDNLNSLIRIEYIESVQYSDPMFKSSDTNQFKEPILTDVEINTCLKHSNTTTINRTYDIMVQMYKHAQKNTITFVSDNILNNMRKLRYATTSWQPKGRFFILNYCYKIPSGEVPLKYRDGKLISVCLYGMRHWVACVRYMSYKKKLRD